MGLRRSRFEEISFFYRLSVDDLRKRRLQAESLAALGLLCRAIYRRAGPGDRSSGRRAYDLRGAGICLIFCAGRQ